MLIFLFKALCILIPLLIIYVSSYSQGGLLTPQPINSDSTFGVFINTSPSNTYGNRIDLFHLTKKSASFKVRSFKIDSLHINRNDGMSDYIAGFDNAGNLKAPHKDSLRFKILNILGLQDSLNAKMYATSAAIIAALTFTPYNGTANPNGFINTELDPVWTIASTNYRTKTQNDLLYQPIGIYVTSEVDPTVPAYSKSLTAFSVVKTSTDALYEPMFSKNTAFNKNFGSTSGTIAEGNDSRILLGASALQPAGNGSSLTGITQSQVSGLTAALAAKLDITTASSTYEPKITASNTTNKYWNGYKNFVAFNTDSIAEGVTNLYYTLARFNTAFSAKTTTDLNEGSNLYYTNTRARAAVSITNTGTSGASIYNNGTGVFNIPIYTSISSTDTLSAARTFNTSYLNGSTYTDIRPSASITCNLSLTGGQSGIIFLETSPDNATWTQKSSMVGSNTGTLTIGLATQQITGGQLTTIVPPNYYWRLRTSNTTGTPTYTMNIGNKTVY